MASHRLYCRWITLADPAVIAEVTVSVILIGDNRLVPVALAGIAAAMVNVIRAVGNLRIHAVRVDTVGAMANAILIAALVVRAECVVRMVSAMRTVDSRGTMIATIMTVATTLTMIIRHRRHTVTGVGQRQMIIDYKAPQ